MAEWLDTVFHNFDGSIFEWMHGFHNAAGGFFDGFLSFITFFGKGGWFFIVLSAAFLPFKKTRRTGLGMAIALIIGVITVNLLLKNIVARPRPYTHSEFSAWWAAVGSHQESDYSFPSGHTMAAFTTMTAMFISCDKRWSWAGLVFAVLMAFSRIYLIVHYTTDVLASIVIGVLAGIGGVALANLIYSKSKGKFGVFLNEFDVIDALKKKKET